MQRVGVRYNSSVKPAKSMCAIFGSNSFNSHPLFKLFVFVLKSRNKMTYTRELVLNLYLDCLHKHKS